MKEVSGSALAELTGKGWRTCQERLRQAGISPLRREGRADLYDSARALAAIYGEGIGAGEFDDQRQRLAAAQSEKVEHDNAVRRGRLADMTQVMGAWTECIANARAKLLSLPSKVAPELVQVADANIIATRIRVEVYAALTELAQWPPAAGGSEAVPATDGDDVDAASGSDREPVGGSVPAPVKRKRRRTRAVAD